MNAPRLLVLMCLLIGLASAVRATAPAPATVFQRLNKGEHQTVLVYGTSLTAGGAWTGALKHWLDQQYPGKVKFINSGGPGQNSDWGVAQLKSKVLDHRPDLVFIEFAYNDAHEKFKMPVERGASNLKTIVDAIRAQNPDAVIVLQTMNVGWDAPNGKLSLTVRPQHEQFNDNYRNLARQEGLPLLDHYAAWKKLKESDPKTYQAYIPDGTHPERAGSLAVTWIGVKAWLETARASATSIASSDTAKP